MAEKNGELRYLMIVDGKHEWLPLGRAGATYDNGFAVVEIGNMVIMKDGNTRDITEAERQSIANVADNHSANK